MLSFMQANSDSKIVKCECGGVMEVFPGQVEYNSKNDMGQIMTP